MTRGTRTEKMLRLWSQQARQLTPRRGTVAHLGSQGLLCSHSHGKSTEGISEMWLCEPFPRWGFLRFRVRIG